jgi:hypothetical protein
MAHAAFAPGSPSIALKLNRPAVGARAPLTVPALDGVVVDVVEDGAAVVVVVVDVVQNPGFLC